MPGSALDAQLSHKPIELPSGNSVVLASAELSAGLLPPDATAWLRAAPDNTTTEPPATRQREENEDGVTTKKIGNVRGTPLSYIGSH